MAASTNPKEPKKGSTVVIAMDDSEFSEYALECKLTVFELFMHD